ncbi:MAG: hypothetical protein EA379_00785 [Phycisphaerales bacterium]|nr:MAG: hypothetical protein EA379_00785 [Phycisphaerales bacterium]
MARRTTIRIDALQEIVEDLRFAPAATARRHADAAAALAAEIDDDGAYAAAWITTRITGYRPDAASDGGDAVIVGRALRAELSALVERLSERANLHISDLGAGALWIDDLCARWGVTARTLERRRRQGLIGRRVRDDAGRTRLAFALADVERFEAAHPRAGRSASPAGRIDDRTRAAILRRAQRYRRRLGWSRNQTAARLARRYARSREAIRTILRDHDDALPAPVFPGEPPITLAARQSILRRRARGAGVAALAREHDRTRAAIHRALRLERRRLLGELDLRVPAPPTFQRPDAHDVILAPPGVRTGLGAPHEPDVGAFVRLAGAAAPPDERAEHARAVAACYLRWRAARALETLDPRNPGARALDAVETDLRWCARVLAATVADHRRLALATIEERLGAPFETLAPEHARALHAQSMAALARAALAFDPFQRDRRRVAGAASAALQRALSRWSREHHNDAHPSPTAAKRTGAPGVALADWTRHVAPWQQWLEPPPGVRTALEHADEETRRAVELRYGWSGDPPRTREDAAALLDIPAARVAALEQRAARLARDRARAAHARDTADPSPSTREDG